MIYNNKLASFSWILWFFFLSQKLFLILWKGHLFYFVLYSVEFNWYRKINSFQCMPGLYLNLMNQILHFFSPNRTSNQSCNRSTCSITQKEATAAENNKNSWTGNSIWRGTSGIWWKWCGFTRKCSGHLFGWGGNCPHNDFTEKNWHYNIW